MDYRNEMVFFCNGLYAPRWFAVTVWSDEQGHTFATPDGFKVDSPWCVDMVRCECGREYVERHGVRRNVHGWVLDTALKPRCRACDNAQRAAEQLRRRARARTLATACAVCGAQLSARRSSRKYCSPACRQRVHRQRSAEHSATQEGATGARRRMNDRREAGMLTLTRTTDGSGRERPCVACGAWFTAESRPLVLTDGGGLLEGVCPTCKADEVSVSASQAMRDERRPEGAA